MNILCIMVDTDKYSNDSVSNQIYRFIITRKLWWPIYVVEASLRMRKVSGLNQSRVNSKTKKLSPVASLGRFHHLRPRTGMFGPESV